MLRTLESQLLAMPATMRCLLLQQTLPPLHLSSRLFSSTSTTLSPRRHAAPTTRDHKASTAAVSQTPPSPQQTPPSLQQTPPADGPPPLSFLPPPSNSPLGPIPSPPVPSLLLSQATAILTNPRPRFLYSAPRFLNLPLNLSVPEVCLLGRSNVGKSTLINALAGIPSAVAGRSHGASVSSSSRKQSPGSSTPRGGIAITSAKAGCTKTLNGYAFGLPASKSTSQRHQDTLLSSKGPTTTRSERRDAASARHRAATPPPDAAMVLMDMPGYGLNSRQEWGVEIAKYLSRRKALRGAVLLIDAVAGPKQGDTLVLRLLRDAGVRTAVVLTKADKLGYGCGVGG
ncbi:hypothetical protein NKR19_g10118, partial [Coniochaeta hoffmannii]